MDVLKKQPRPQAPPIAKIGNSDQEMKSQDQPSFQGDQFNKHYNRELKVTEDEIPLILIELN